jgi:hypothetical protein
LIGATVGFAIGYGVTHPGKVAALGNSMGGGSGGERFAENKQEGRAKEQKAIDDRGGVKNLDNKRNEIAPPKKKVEEQ